MLIAVTKNNLNTSETIKLNNKNNNLKYYAVHNKVKYQ